MDMGPQMTKKAFVPWASRLSPSKIGPIEDGLADAKAASFPMDGLNDTKAGHDPNPEPNPEILMLRVNPSPTIQYEK